MRERLVSDLGMERLEVNCRCRRLCGPPAKQLLRAVQQPVFSLFDLVGVQVKLLRQFVQRLFTAHRLQSHLRLKRRITIASHSSCHVGLPSAGSYAARRQSIHL